MNRAKRLLLVLLLMAAAAAARAQLLGAPTVAAVKAAYLVRLASFVEWPAETPAPAASPFVIAVVGDDAVASELEALAAGRNLRGHPLQVRRWRDVDPAATVQVAYVAGSRLAQVRETAARLHGPVLVVTDVRGGLAAGAAINFVIDGGRVKFEASPRAAEGRGLHLSSRLLEVAVTVEGRQP